MEMDLKSTISDIVESMLPRFSVNLGLHMIIKLNFHDYGESKLEKITRKVWHKTYAIELIFIRFANSTKVLGRSYDYLDSHKVKTLRNTSDEVILKQYSDHDSCWREDGFSEFSQCFIKAVESYENDMGIKFSNNNVSQFNTFDICGNPTYVEIDYECIDIKNRWTSDYKVKVNKQLTIQEAATYMPNY